MLQTIVKDIEWRMGELASLTSLPYRYGMAEHHVKILVTYSVPAIYALWEGFVRNSFISYSRKLNLLQLNINDVDENLLTHALTSGKDIDLNISRGNFISKKKYIQTMKTKYVSPLELLEVIPTKSNINYEVINDILMRFNLIKLDEKYKKRLDNLLRFRNEIAHGERRIPIKKQQIEDFSNLVQDLMIEIYGKIEEGFIKKTYLK